MLASASHKLFFKRRLAGLNATAMSGYPAGSDNSSPLAVARTRNTEDCDRDNWTVGILTNHIWSYAGDAGRDDVSATFLQPFVAYAAQGGWTFTVNTQSTYDWVAKAWSVPLLFQVSKLTSIGKQPISIAAGVKYWAQSPDSGPHGLGGLLSISFIFK